MERAAQVAMFDLEKSGITYLPKPARECLQDSFCQQRTYVSDLETFLFFVAMSGHDA